MVLERDPALLGDRVDRLLVDRARRPARRRRGLPRAPIVDDLEQARVAEEPQRLVQRLLPELPVAVQHRIGDARSEPLERREHLRHAAHQLPVGDAAPAVGHERGRAERRGRDHRRAVDLVGHPVRDPLHQRPALRRRQSALVGLERLAPRGLVAGGVVDPREVTGLADQALERHHVAELQVEAAVLRAEHAPGAEQPADALGRLLAARLLVHVRLLLDDPLVADRHRHERDLAIAELQRRVDDHREDPELRRQELAGARAPALDEELEVVALDEDRADVGVDERGVELLALEAAADEERARSGAGSSRAGRTRGCRPPRSAAEPARAAKSTYESIR